MNMKHTLFIALVVWLILSFVPSLLLTNFIGKSRAGAAR